MFLSLSEKKKPKETKDTKPKTDDKRSNPKMILIIFVIIVVLVVSAIIAVVLLNNSDPSQNDTATQSKFSIHYTVEASDDPYIKVLGVTIRMDIDKLSPEQMIYIYKSGILSPILSCVDDRGNDIVTNATSQLMSIGPIETSVKSVTMKYDVMVGRSRNYVQCSGDFYSDLLVFSGENVLMTPYLNYSEQEKSEKYISSISFNLKADYDWKAIIPFREPLSDDFSFKVENPTWTTFSAITRSSYCFGQFSKQDMMGNAVYFDEAIVDNVPYLSMEVMTKFLNYYTELFGELSSDAPLVLLRNSTENNAVILGGVGAKGAAISIEVNYADECQTLSSTLYHLFFDSKIKAPNLRYPPNLWLYNGLSNYHVVKSSIALSQAVKDLYSLTVIDDPEMAYLDYLYFSLKEPDFLQQNPSLENEMDEVQSMYYMDIKVPVMIDLINYAIADTSGGNLITALLDMAGEEKNLNIDDFLKKKCGNYYEAVLRCFSGNSILPNYRNLKLDGKVSDEEITSHLDDTDARLTDLFSHGHEYVGYYSFPLVILNPVKFQIDAEARGVRYSTDEIQAEVKGFSTLLNQYLMQYAMFAKLSGYDELTYENVKKMYTEANASRWVEYCENLGYKDPVE